MTTLATRRGYRRKVNRSLCRKKTVRKCRKVRGCKNTKKTAKKTRYCRKRHNKRLVTKGGKHTPPALAHGQLTDRPSQHIAQLQRNLNHGTTGAMGAQQTQSLGGIVLPLTFVPPHFQQPITGEIVQPPPQPQLQPQLQPPPWMEVGNLY